MVCELAKLILRFDKLLTKINVCTAFHVFQSLVECQNFSMIKLFPYCSNVKYDFADFLTCWAWLTTLLLTLSGGFISISTDYGQAKWNVWSPGLTTGTKCFFFFRKIPLIEVGRNIWSSRMLVKYHMKKQKVKTSLSCCFEICPLSYLQFPQADIAGPWNKINQFKCESLSAFLVPMSRTIGDFIPPAEPIRKKTRSVAKDNGGSKSSSVIPISIN